MPKEFIEWLDKGNEKYGLACPPMDAQTALNILKDYLLGEDWYDPMPESGDQVNTAIVLNILNKYSKEYRKDVKRFNKKTRGNLMATLNVDQMRRLVAGVYRSDSWKIKVAMMPDSQVIAIYCRFNREGRFTPVYDERKKKPKRGKRIETNPVEDFGGVQLTFDDIL